MRNPPDDAAEQTAGRRRGHRGSQSGSHRGTPQGGQRSRGQDDGAAEGPAGGGSSVFAPGYAARRDSAPDRLSGGHSRPAAGPGPVAEGATGKGPVRGFPPLPGQSLPMYPPGQFAAWNRGLGGQARHGGVAAPPGPAGPPSSPGWQGGQQAEPGRAPGSGYYGQDDGGYSQLAVSDPAADVTSTQTWQAVDEGRATGTWTSPFRDEDSPASRPWPGAAGTAGSRAGTGPRRVAGAGIGGPALARPDSGRHGSSGPAGPDLAEPGARPAGGLDRSGDRGGQDGPGAPGAESPRAAESPRGAGPAGRGGAGGRRLTPWSPEAAAQRAARGTAGGAAARQGPADAGPQAEGSAAAATQAPAVATGRRSAGGTSTTSRRAAPPAGRRPARKRGRAYPRGAILIAVVLVVAAGAALYFGARLISSPPHKTAGAQTTPTPAATPTPTPTPSLGLYGHIGSRASDPAPLTAGQLYPLSFTAGGAPFARTAVRLSKSCSGAVVGSNLQSAIGSAGCTQVARASYLSGKMMGTIGVFNLKTAKDARSASRAAGASNFVKQVAGRKGPTAKLGHGNGVEEALFKGHYLILIWAEFTDTRTPKTQAQQRSLGGFMSELWLGTANVSLTNRMLSGSPA